MESRYYPLHADHTLGQWYLSEFFQVLLALCAGHVSDADTSQWHGELTEQNVMEYFEASPFYDRSSNNQVLRMQTMHAAPEHQMNIEEELKWVFYYVYRAVSDEGCLVGALLAWSTLLSTQRLLVSSSFNNKTVFLLLKVRMPYKCTPETIYVLLTVRPMSIYMILNGGISQAPDLYTVLSTRLVG
jgi:mediator of RNA polymerase II transcription subunit 6